MADIEERLQRHAPVEANELEDDLLEAADTIALMRKALEEVKQIAADDHWGMPDVCCRLMQVADDALSPTSKDNEHD